MKLKNKILIRSAGFALSGLIPWWMSSLDYKVAYYDPIIDPAYRNDGKRRIYVFWHEYILSLIYLRKHCNLAMLLSKHGDADVLEQIATMLGFDTVRGSTNRGGVRALREMMEKGKQHHLTITPDGPRGPRRLLAPGCVYLASKLQIPIVALGVGYDRPYRFNSWDRFAIPRYGTRVRYVVSGDISVPPDLDRDELERYRLHVESLLNGLTEDAEDWALSGDTMNGESSVLPGPKYSMFYYVHPKAAWPPTDR